MLAWNTGFEIALSVIIGLLLIKIISLCFSQEVVIHARDIRKGHKWSESSLLTSPLYCSICESLMLTGGYFCESCGVAADAGCLRKANKNLPCKAISSKEQTLKHHMVKGNLPFNSICSVCDDECGNEPGLTDFFCCWCQRAVHAKCKPSLGDVCDLSRHRTFVVPPTCIELKRTYRVRTQYIIEEVRVPPIPKWSPLIVIANRKSGNNDGAYVLAAFRRVLNATQVIDLAESDPKEGLKWCNLLEDVTCRILIAGGDGTIGWVLNDIDSLQLKHRPPIAILPLGTGNDLSRFLGWGPGHAGPVDPFLIIRQLTRAKEIELDRWKVTVSSIPRTPMSLNRFRPRSKAFYMNNYMSIGVDALVTLNFHTTRESPFYFSSSRLFNKFLYLTYGTKDVLERCCKNLEKKVQLFMDNEEVTLPEVESIVLLNIPYWGAGVKPWQLGTGHMNFPLTSVSDGKLEVLCVFSSFHIAQMQVGLSEPFRLGQASEVRIILKEKIPMQVNGEPWKQSPCEMSISFHNKAPMLQFEQ